ncbi:MAG: pknD 5, partial [Subtercola sp.]|nr:pknD 5 [Subtercola sp.]
MAVPVTHDPLALTGTGSSPRSIAVGPNGEFYTANFGANDITAFDVTGSNLFLQQLGPLKAPTAIARDSSGALWTANSADHSISKYIPGHTTPSTIGLTITSRPTAITIDASHVSDPSDVVYTADSADNVVAKSTEAAGIITTNARWALLAPNTAPKGIVTDSLGNVYTANSLNSTVSKITPAGVVTDRFTEFSPGDGPDAITIDSHGMLYVANYSAGTVVKIDSTQPALANVVASYTLPTNAEPMGIAVDAHDNVYVSESGPNTVALIPAG